MAYHFNPDSELDPQKLTEEEVKDPYLVLIKFFDSEKLPRIRALFKTWVRTGIAGTQIEILDEIEKAQLFDFFERVEKLIEANHIINVRTNQLEL